MQFVFKLSYALMLMLFSVAALATANKPSADFETLIVELEQQLLQRNEEYLGKVFDMDTAIDTAFEKAFDDDSNAGQFRRGFDSTFKPQLARLGVGGMLMQNLQGEVKVKLVTSHHYSAGGGNAIYRFSGDESDGYVYMKMIFKPTDGKLKVIDWFDFARGQLYSDSVAGLIKSVAPSPGLLGTVSDLVKQKHVERQKFVKVMTLVRERQFEQLKTFYQQNKDYVMSAWELMSLISTAASMSGDEAFYRLALSDMAKRYKNDPKASFILLDYYFYENDFNSALAILAVMSKTFDDKDAGVYLMMSNLHIQNKNWPEALKSINRCAAVEPGFEDCYWNYVTYGVSAGEFEQAVTYLKTLETRFGYEFSQEAFDAEPFYADFVKSQAFKQWLN